MARRHVDSDDRIKAIAADLREYMKGELDAHGYTGDDDARETVIGADMELNAQGMDVWLHRLRKKGEI